MNENKSDDIDFVHPGALSALAEQLPDELRRAAERWPDFTLPVEEVTVEHLKRWGSEINDRGADVMLRFLRFGEVYEHTPRNRRRLMREAIGRSKTWCANALRAYNYVMTVCDGEVPDQVSGPNDLVLMERKHRKVQKDECMGKIREQQAIKKKLEDEELEDEEEVEPIEVHPIVEHLAGLTTALAENLDPVPEMVVDALRTLLRDLEGRVVPDEPSSEATQTSEEGTTVAKGAEARATEEAESASEAMSPESPATSEPSSKKPSNEKRKKKPRASTNDPALPTEESLGDELDELIDMFGAK